jgi:small subunit ribosomal protein S6
MNTYELVVVFEGKLTPAKKKTEIAKIEKLVKVLNGKVLNLEDWGVKEFAYPIKKNSSGVFLIFNLELEGESAKQLMTKIKLEEQILRYLLIRKDVK